MTRKEMLDIYHANEVAEGYVIGIDFRGQVRAYFIETAEEKAFVEPMFKLGKTSEDEPCIRFRPNTTEKFELLMSNIEYRVIDNSKSWAKRAKAYKEAYGWNAGNLFESHIHVIFGEEQGEWTPDNVPFYERADVVSKYGEGTWEVKFDGGTLIKESTAKRLADK